MYTPRSNIRLHISLNWSIREVLLVYEVGSDEGLRHALYVIFVAQRCIIRIDDLDPTVVPAFIQP